MRYYTDVSDEEIIHLFRRVKIKKKLIGEHKYISYYNTAITFDTETTSTTSDDEKVAYCYVWQVCLESVTIYGRTLSEFHFFCEKISRVLNLSDEKRLIVYVHNLDFDFQFIRKYFTWIDIFARVERKPLYALCDLGLEFKCSYMLTLLPLAKLPEQMPNYEYKKMIGDLDYNLPRHSRTPLSEKELKYCENDVIILYDYIQYEIRRNGNNVTKIPLTKTGYVRRECKNALKKDREFWSDYKSRIEKAHPDTELFTLLFKAYQGGYTHANSKYCNLALTNVSSIDFASSYPSVMVCNKFPWRFRKIEIQSKEMLERMIADYACVFEVMFENIEAITTTTIISTSKCEYLLNPKVDNGRLISADICRTYITDLDYKSIKEFYRYDAIVIGLFYYAKYEPLPKPIINTVLKAYSDKTELKGVKGKELEYTVSKGIINGIYGMTVTNPVCDTIIYNGEWTHIKPDIVESLESDRERAFLLYQWGVWVSAHARRNLLKVVRQIENFVVYCDTDSIKFVKNPHAQEIIEKYNAEQISRFEEIANKYDYTIPRTHSGQMAYLGIFDYEGDYTFFKTLGAKRYVTEKNGEFGIAIAGLPKKQGAKYIKENGGFVFFSDGMTIPASGSGKKEHTYIDEMKIFDMTDYCGVTEKCIAPSAVHLSNTGFTMSLAQDFVDLFTKKQVSLLGLDIGKETVSDLAIGAVKFIKQKRGEFI